MRTLIVADANVVINLIATNRAAEILDALGEVLIVAPAALRETIYLEHNDGGPREPISLDSLTAAGKALLAVPTNEEAVAGANLREVVGAGEAEAMAIALARGLPFATDDRRARRLGAERGAELLSTLELLHQWQERGTVPDAGVGDALFLVSTRATYRPARSHPLYEWWLRCLQARSGAEPGAPSAAP